MVILPTQNPDGREARHPAQRLRLRHEPGLVRAHPARDRRQARGAAAATRRCCSSTSTRWAQTTTSSRRTPTPIYHEITDRVDVLDQRPLRRGDASTSSTAQDIPYFNHDIYDLLYMGYGDTVPTTGFLGAGMTFEKSSDDRIASGSASSTSRSGRRCRRLAGEQGRRAEGWAASLPAGLPPGPRGAARAQRGRSTPATRSSPRCRTSRCGTTSSAPTSPQGRRGARHRAPAAADGRRGTRLTAPLRGADYTPYAARRPGDDAAGRHVLGADGAGAEALGPGDAARGHLRAVPVLLRRHRVEPAAALQRRGRPVGGGADPAPRWCRRPGTGRARAARRRADGGVWRMSTGTVPSSRPAGCAGCWTRTGGYRTSTSPRRHRRGGLAGVDVLVVPDGDAAGGENALGNTGVRELREWLADGGRLVA